MRAAVLCTFFVVLGVILGLGTHRSPAADDIAKTDPRTPTDEKKSFHVPPGFEVQLVAAEPDIHKPLNIAFDDRGRLWVTDTVEYPFPAPPSRKARDTVKVLEDFGDDGRARKVTTFADDLNIPIGLLPITNGVIVHSIPNIYRITDTNGDGKGDRREVLYGSIGFGDTHGMTSGFNWGFDGWIYAGHGYANTSTIKAKDGSSITVNSGNTYRFKPDGSRIEQFTWGQVNPFGLSFDPLGNLFSADCHTKPIMMLLRGGYYESFGKPHDGLGFAPEICPNYEGSTAIAGIAYYAAAHFPAKYRDTAFIGDVVTNHIINYRFERHGSTLRAVPMPDFLLSDDPWFRPVDVKLGPDGALYVADFYNRIIGHYEVPLNHPGRDRERGRIWRIVYRGPDGQGKPSAPRSDWTKATVQELVGDLAHPNLVVRTKATNQLVERGGKESVGAVKRLMQPSSSPFQRMHGLWVLERMESLDDKTLQAAAQDTESGVRVHAMRVLGERRRLPNGLRDLAFAGLKDPDASVQRAAADALGRHPSEENLRPLLDLRHRVPKDDPQLLHTVRMALRDQLRQADSWKKLAAIHPSQDDSHAIADVATGVSSAAAAEYLAEHLRHSEESPQTVVRYVGHVARFGPQESVQAVVSLGHAHRPTDFGHQVALVRAIAAGLQARGATPNDEMRQWTEELTGKLLASTDPGQVFAGIELAGALKVQATQKSLAMKAVDRRLPEGHRRAAVVALVAIEPKAQLPLLGQLLESGAEPFGLREQAANSLGEINQLAARAELLKALPTAPAPVQTVIAANLARSLEGADSLLTAVASGKASARLLQERAVQIRLAHRGVPNLEARLAQLTKGLPPADQRLRELVQRRKEGFASAKTDLALGAKVYEKNCAICHQLGGKGTKVGPQLDGMGNRGLDRLLEDIIDPNRNVDQAFRATTLNLNNGQTISGLVLREEGQVVVLADNQGKEVRVNKKDIDERIVSQLSPMPANLVDQIAEADFYHLLAFLLQQKQAPANKREQQNHEGRSDRRHGTRSRKDTLRLAT